VLFRAAICEDEVKVLQTISARIKTTFASLGLDISIESFSSVEAMLERMESTSFDVFFLDIDLPEMDGVDFGASLREQGSEACIVFISNREERVYDAFKAAPMRFIRKSRFCEEVDEAVMAVATWWERRKNQVLVLSTRGQVNTFPIGDILYVECFDKVQHLITRTQTKTIRATMSELEGKLLEHGFLNPHKGYLVNYKFIDSIESTGITLQNGVSIPISRYKLVDTKNAFLELVSAEPDVFSPYLHKP